MPRILDFADGFESSSEPTKPSTTFTIANNQSSAANVTGLVFASTIRHAEVFVSLYRKDSLQEKASIGKLFIQQKPTGTWSIEPESNFDTFVTTGVTFSITSGGQVQYTSTNYTGLSYVGTMKFVTGQTFDV